MDTPTPDWLQQVGKVMWSGEPTVLPGFPSIKQASQAFFQA